jgi:hypothetical protein
MHARTRPRAGAATTGIAIAGIAVVAATPLAAVTEPLPSAVSGDVRLAATEVPPGGLLTSFLGNQVIYCSFICPPLINTGVTAAVTTLQTPVTFVAAVQTGDLLKAIGITAASVTGPTNAALADAIAADTTVAVPKASNAFEVGVIGLLDIVPAAAGGLPAAVGAVAAAREETFEALNLPIPVTGPTVVPNGLLQVATLGAIRVGEVIIFPAFNEVLQATVGVPDAAAQELAVSGDPARAVAAGARTAVGSVSAAANAVSQSVVTAATDIRNAAGQQPLGNVISSTQKTISSTQKASTAPTSANPGLTPLRKVGTSARQTNKEPGSHSSRQVVSTVRQAVRSVVKNVSKRRPTSFSQGS